MIVLMSRDQIFIRINLDGDVQFGALPSSYPLGEKNI